MKHQKKQHLQLERLEDRRVPAAFGMPWHDPSHLSISFAPDGADIAAHESTLHAALGRQQPAAQWQRDILRAYQAWAEHANINFGYQADGGQAFGTPGLMQGDPRFGDIRIGAHAMGQEALAIAIPPDPALSGTWSGDVLINSAYTFGGSAFSLHAVMLHEAGHALGLANSASADSVMFSAYNATRTALSGEDIARIQALYGVRAADGYEGAAGNNTRARAAAFHLPDAYAGETPLVAFGDITTRADVDFYAFAFPDDGNDDAHDREVTIRLQTAGSSLLAPRLTVLDQNGRVLAARSSTSVTGDVLQVRLTRLSSEQRLYVRVQAAANDVFAVGRYGLSVRFDKTSSTADEVIDKLLSGPYDGLSANAIDAFFRGSGDVLLNHEEGANDAVASATTIAASAGYANNTRFEAIASLAKKEDVDFYRLTAPGGAARVLTAAVWTADASGFQPSVSVVDAAGRAVAAEVIVGGNGTSTVQVADTVAGQAYYLKVALAPGAAQDKGNYFVSASFGERSTPLRTFAEGALHKDDRVEASRLYVAQTQLFHFVLSAGGQDPGSSVRMTIHDSGGNLVHAISAASGSAVSGSSVLLAPGSYTARFEIENPNGAAVTFRVKGSSQSDPIGPVSLDPTLAPQYTTPPPPSPSLPVYYAYPGFALPYDATKLPGYAEPLDPRTWPADFFLPPELASHPWLILSTDPFYWISLGL